MMKFGQIRKPLMISCLLASAALHVGAIWFVYHHPMQFAQEPLSPLHATALQPVKSEEELFNEKVEKALEESLNTVIAGAHLGLKNRGEESSESLTEPPIEKVLFATSANLAGTEIIAYHTPQEFASSMPPLFNFELDGGLSDFALADDFDETIFSHESETVASIDFMEEKLTEYTVASQCCEDDYTLSDDQFSPSALPTHSALGLNASFVSSLSTLPTPRQHSLKEAAEEEMFSCQQENPSTQLILPNSVDYLRGQWIKRSIAESQLPNLDHYGLEQTSVALQWEEGIDVEMSIMPDRDNKKYLFSLTIHPEFQTNLEPMQQNFYFIIDRSSSVEKGKFNRYKRAVQRALAALNETDTFNVYFLDKQVTKLSNHNLAVSPQTIEYAEEFLDREDHKTHFAATEVYTSLENVLPTKFDPDVLHSVIFITDGNTMLSSAKQKKALSTWAEKYQGNVNFYTAASGKGNNLVLLDLLSYITGGKLLYSDTNAGFPRKLVRLVKDLHNPLLKNITVDISTSDANAKVTLYPQYQSLAPLFANQPYTLTGSVDELCDLTLYIQGKNKGRPLNIHKKVNLKNASNGGRGLEKIWADTQAKVCYEHFLKNGKQAHLTEAKQIVYPYHGDIAND